MEGRRFKVSRDVPEHPNVWAIEDAWFNRFEIILFKPAGFSKAYLDAEFWYRPKLRAIAMPKLLQQMEKHHG